LFNFAMCTFASKCLPIELVPCSDECRRTWWQTIHMMPGLPVSSIPQCKKNHHKGTCRESSHAIGCFESTFIESHQASKMICKVRSLESWIKTRSLFDDILTCSNEVFKDLVSDIVIGNCTLRNSIRVTIQKYVLVR
jgi:hypothetical protein